MFLVWRPWGMRSGMFITRFGGSLLTTRHDECGYGCF